VTITRENLATDARCGRCGYSAIGLQTLICPECGGDFREVGIRVDMGRSDHVVAGAVLAAIFFTIALLVVWLSIKPSIESLLPLERVYTTSETLKSLAAPPRHYVLQAQRRSWSPQRPTLPVTISLFTATATSATSAAGAPAAMLLYDPADNTAHTVSGGNSAGPAAPFNVQAVLAWLKQAGLDDQDPNVIEEARMLTLRVRSAARVRGIITSPGSTSYGETSNNRPLSVQGSSSAVGRTPAGSEPLIAAAFIVAWAAGIWSLWRRTRAPRGAVVANASGTT
jgi:hypothetical protein